MPTSTVGKVLDIREHDGRSWALLDFTGLWYDSSLLIPADVNEYKEVKFKYKKADFQTELKSVEDLIKEREEVDISGFTPSGGG